MGWSALLDGVALLAQDDTVTVNSWGSSLHSVLIVGVFVLLCIFGFIWWLKRS